MNCSCCAKETSDKHLPPSLLLPPLCLPAVLRMCSVLPKQKHVLPNSRGCTYIFILLSSKIKQFKQFSNRQNGLYSRYNCVILGKSVKIYFFSYLILDNYVHRLVASKTDGKMVQYECEGDICPAEKIDALQLEVSITTPAIAHTLSLTSETEMFWCVVHVCSTRTSWQASWSLRGFTGRIRLFTWRRKRPRRCETLCAAGYMSVFLLVSASSTKHLVCFSDQQHEG